MHQLPIGSTVLVADAYAARILEQGTIPSSHPCQSSHGQPGYRCHWYEIDEQTGTYTGRLSRCEDGGPDEGWVLQGQCRPPRPGDVLPPTSGAAAG